MKQMHNRRQTIFSHTRQLYSNLSTANELIKHLIRGHTVALAMTTEVRTSDAKETYKSKEVRKGRREGITTTAEINWQINR